MYYTCIGGDVNIIINYTQDKRINLLAAFKTTPKCENTRNTVGATVPVARKCANRSSTGDRGRSPLQRYRRIPRSTELMRLSCNYANLLLFQQIYHFATQDIGNPEQSSRLCFADILPTLLV